MKIIERIENIFAAVAFAEAGEHETARRILGENGTTRGRYAVCADECEHISHSASKA